MTTGGPWTECSDPTDLMPMEQYHGTGPSTRAAIWSFNRPACGGADPRQHQDPMPYSAFAAELDGTFEASPAVGPYVLVGHSFVGLIALAYTQRHPGMVAGIVLVDPSFPHMDLGGRRTGPKIDGDDRTGIQIDVDTDADLVATAVLPASRRWFCLGRPGWPDYISADEDDRWHAWHSDLATHWAAPRLVAEALGINRSVMRRRWSGTRSPRLWSACERPASRHST